MIPFLNKARYPDLSSGFQLYLNRSAATPKDRLLDKSQYYRIVKAYCSKLSERLEEEGSADLPCDIGSLVAVRIRKRPVYDKRENKYKIARSVDWNKTRETGTIRYKDNPNTFGFVFSPKHIKGRNIFRCFGFVANKALYKRMKKLYDTGDLPFYLADKDIYVI